MAQQLRALTALPEVLSSIPSTTKCNSNSKALHRVMHKHASKMLIETINKMLKKKNV